MRVPSIIEPRNVKGSVHGMVYSAERSLRPAVELVVPVAGGARRQPVRVSSPPGPCLLRWASAMILPAARSLRATVCNCAAWDSWRTAPTSSHPARLSSGSQPPCRFPDSGFAPSTPPADALRYFSLHPIPRVYGYCDPPGLPGYGAPVNAHHGDTARNGVRHPVHRRTAWCPRIFVVPPQSRRPQDRAPHHPVTQASSLLVCGASCPAPPPSSCAPRLASVVPHSGTRPEIKPTPPSLERPGYSRPSLTGLAHRGHPQHRSVLVLHGTP